MATGLTSNYSIPYPLSTDPVNVAGDVQQLAEKIDINLTEWTQDTSAGMWTSGGTFSNGLQAPTYNDSTGKMSMTLAQDIRTSASPTFVGLTLTGDASVNGGDITTSQTTFNLINTTATTLNIGGAATTLNIGNGSGQANFAGHVNIATGKQYEINNVSVLTATTLGSSVVNSSLQTVGTITSGTWSATTIAVNKGGTGLTSYTAGDLVYASASTTISKLGIGSNNYVLTSNGTSPVWSANTGTGNVVRATSPTLTTPNIGAATGISLSTTSTIVASYTTGRVSLGLDAGGNVNIGRVDNTSSTPYIDFNSGSTTVDYDARIQVSGGSGVTGGGDMSISAANIYSTANMLPTTDNTGVIGNATYTWSNGQFTNLTIDSTLNVRAAIDLSDSDQLRLGASDDAKIWYDGTLNVLEIELESTANSLNITDNGTDKVIFARSTGNISTAGTELRGLYGQASGTSNFSLVVERGSDPDVDIRWNETGDTWQFTNDGTTYYDIPTSAGSGGTGLETVLMFSGM